ncbi:hypothetical protein Ccar_16635 [Clostridium carboxidivorans P7]|uniref:hypothetical protein n=1 Tax=Clostridium carboxidivorans TaxID=217159 RepID=UPI00064F0B57|nr:hypothetical protein [Clostridium carboxidivorans]AKN32399.1 hypothetical protein Ccar_16635 [Clostridium carboxidivorans P7]
MLEIKFSEESLKNFRALCVGLVVGFTNAIGNVVKAVQKAEENMAEKKKLESIIGTKPMDTSELVEFMDKLSEDLKEVNQVKIDDGDKLRQSWKHRSYKNRFNSRVVNKKILHHKCRNNC